MGFLQRPVIILMKSPLFCFLFYSFPQGFISPFGGLGGPEEDQVLRLVYESVFLGSFPSDSLH